MTAFLKTLDRGVQTFLRYLGTVLFIALGVILFTNVVVRFAGRFEMFPNISMHWFDEIVELLFAYLVFYGAAALWGTKGHFSVGDWISKRLPGRTLAAIYKFLVTLISVLFLVIFFYYSLRLTRTSTELSTVFQIPKKVMYSCMPVSSFIMLCYSVAEAVEDLINIFNPDSGEIHGQEATSM